ncbi:salicylate hydroxylase [Xylariaceae sp. FL1019]|nr:salicylate hydroxylase [Xylariaceae sp. FL1019]
MRIAIIGGGLAGVGLANLLVRDSRLQVEVFECKEFSERGTTVGLGRSALEALDRILPKSMDTLVQNAGAIPTQSIGVRVGSGPYAGEFLFEIPNFKPRISVPRAALLKELLSQLPQDMLHANMRLTRMDPDAIGATLTFDNGTMSHFDAVIGADGINSFVRGYVVSEQEHRSSPAGFWDHLAFVPVEHIRGKMEDELLKPGQQYAFAADGAQLLYALAAGGTMVQAIISSVDEQPPVDGSRMRVLSDAEKDRLRCKWDVGNALVEVRQPWGILPTRVTLTEMKAILSAPSVQVYALHEHSSTASYFQNNICLIGDAAHASTPFQGAGAGQALEDCVILSSLLGEITDPRDISRAFEVFEAVRMPRCKQVIKSSKEVGCILCGQRSYDGLEEWRNALAHKWDFIHNFDLEDQERRAVQDLKRLLSFS